MFRVEWQRSARNELASLWMDANSEKRRVITAATHTIDQRLQVNPQAQGESRPGGRRIYFAAPLGVLFRVDLQRSTVSCGARLAVLTNI